jgi:hypothetical protein
MLRCGRFGRLCGDCLILLVLQRLTHGQLHGQLSELPPEPGKSLTTMTKPRRAGKRKLVTSIRPQKINDLPPDLFLIPVCSQVKI